MIARSVPIRSEQKDWWKRCKAAVMKLNSTKQERLGMSPIEAERGVRPRGVMDFDPSLLHEVDGRTVINPAMTAEQCGRGGACVVVGSTSAFGHSSPRSEA